MIGLDDRNVLNHCHKYLARDRGRTSEGWRFPIVDTFRDPESDSPHRFNRVTFVWDGRSAPNAAIRVDGSFITKGGPVEMRPVLAAGEDTGFRTATVVVPIGQVHSYRFLVDGKPMLDPINPQRTRNRNLVAALADHLSASLDAALNDAKREMNERFDRVEKTLNSIMHQGCRGDGRRRDSGE